MPTKYKDSVRTVSRDSKVGSTQHYYVKSLSNTALVEMVQNNGTIPKLRAKLMNEVVRRKLDLLVV